MKLLKINIPAVEIKTLEGKPFNAANIGSTSKPTLLVFWATCCAPCKKELSSISKVYKEWKNKTGIEVVAVSVDLPQYINEVKPFIEANNWNFKVYLDVERNLMKAMNAYSTPHSFLIDKKGEVIWDKQGFVNGDETLIYQKILEVIKY
ncbi:TlpA family protein disulfide reductase [Tenacibaculum pelagium]|nr:TlpA disulfide reductase family protein [Tenacibaculum pelagium]